MKTRILMSIVLIMATCLIGFTSYGKDEQPELIKMRTTAYCLPGKTCTGADVRLGIAATGRKDLVGKTIIIYQRLPGDEIGKGLGIYEVLDSGCNENVIDVWQPDLDWCQNYMNIAYQNGAQGRIFVEVIEDCNG